MSMSMFLRNFLTLPQMRVKNNSCQETRETEHGVDDPKKEKTEVVSSDDECNSMASSNTEICGEIDYQDLEICDEETAKVVGKGDVNDLPPSECDGYFGVNHSLCKISSVQSVSTKQIVELTDDKQKYPIQKTSNQDWETTAVSGEEVKFRPILLIPVDLCGKGEKEICIEKSTSLNGSIVTSPLEEKPVATKESYMPSMQSSSNTALLNASEGSHKIIDHCVGRPQEPPMKSIESYSNGFTDRRQLLRKTDGQENNKTHVHTFQLKSLVNLDYCNDKTKAETAQELVLSSSKKSTAIVSDQLPDNESSSHPLQLEDSRVKEKLSPPITPNGFVTASRIVCEDEVPSPEGSQCFTTTQMLLSSENAQDAKLFPYSAANDNGPTSSLCSDAWPLLSSKLPPGSTLFNSQGVFRTTDKEKPFMCGFCGETSDKYYALNQHIAMQHEAEKRYACEICGRRFAQPSNLASHAKHHIQERPFACDQCGRRFKSQGVLRRHTAAHTKDRPFSCKICHKSFESKSFLLSKHSKVHKKEKGSFICNICKKRFNYKRHLSQHMTVHSGEKLFKCSFCDLHFRRDIRLQQHMITHKETRELLQGDAQNAEKNIKVLIQLITNPDKPKFIQCNSKAEEKTAQELILSSNREDPVKVSQDNASLVEISSHPFQLENHNVLTEPSFTKAPSRLSATRPYQRKGYATKVVNRKRVSFASGVVYENEDSALESSQYSTTLLTLLSGAGKEHPLSSFRQSVSDDGKSFSCRNHVQSIVASKPSPDNTLPRYQHVIYTKGKEKPFSCGYCGKAYKIRHSVFGHIIDQHKEKRYSCEFCGKRFSQPSGLASHARIHTQEKPLSCDQCGKKFRHNASLRSHKIHTHSEERLFSCDKCSKSFKTRDALLGHKESHKTKEQKKGVICDTCERKFRKPSLLKEHMMIHTGEKPFKCTLCEKQFRKKIQLRNHMYTHSGKNRTACSVCGKILGASRMPDHMRMHAGEKPFECNVCGKRFPKKQNLEGHMRSHTGEKPFACIGCDKRFTLYSNMVTHKAKCAVLSETLA